AVRPEQAPVDLQVAVGETAEHDLAKPRGVGQRRTDRGNGHPGGLLDRVSIDPGTDAGEREGGQVVLRGELDRAAVAGGEQLRLAGAAAAPDRTDGMDDVFRGQAM